MLVLKEEQAFIKDNKVEFRFYHKHIFFGAIQLLSNKRSNKIIHDPLRKTYTLIKKGKPVARYTEISYRKTMPSQTFYRIEHSSRIVRVGNYEGPYWEEKSIWGDKKGRTHNDANHPGVSEDCLHYDDYLASKKVSDKKYLLYGFESLKSLKKWFTSSELSRLKKLGYVISKYESCYYYIGKNQVAFRPLGERKVK